MPSNPFNPPYSTRSFFCNHTGALLQVTHNGVPRTIGLRLFSSISSTCRKHVCFLVPAADYSWNNLPSHAFCMISNIEYKLDSINPPTSQPEYSPRDSASESSDDHLDIASGLNYLLKTTTPASAAEEPRVHLKTASLKATMGLIDAIIDTDSSPAEAPTSYQPTILPQAGSLPDGLAPATAPQEASLNSAAFAPSVRCAALTPLRRALNGLFTGPAIRMDARLPDSPRVASTFTGKLAMGFALLAAEAGRELCQPFAHLYYFDVMAVSASPAPRAPVLLPKPVAASPAVAAKAAANSSRAKRRRLVGKGIPSPDHPSPPGVPNRNFFSHLMPSLSPAPKRRSTHAAPPGTSRLNRSHSSGAATCTTIVAESSTANEHTTMQTSERQAAHAP